MSKFWKFLASFGAGALAGGIGAVTMGQVSPYSIGVSALIAGIAAVTGHALPSPLGPNAQTKLANLGTK